MAAMTAGESSSSARSSDSSGIVAKQLRIPFILLVLCFTAWGAAAKNTDKKVGLIRGKIEMYNFH